MYSVVTKNVKNGRMGYCTHIGKNQHVPENYQNIILTGTDFPNKIYIRLKDI
jgi:hypothetical protein